VRRRSLRFYGLKYETNISFGWLAQTAKAVAPLPHSKHYLRLFFAAFFSSTTACAAANRAIGTRNGEALT